MSRKTLMEMWTEIIFFKYRLINKINREVILDRTQRMKKRMRGLLG